MRVFRDLINGLDKKQRIGYLIFIPAGIVMSVIVISLIASLFQPDNIEEGLEQNPYKNISFNIVEANQTKIAVVATKSKAYHLREKIEAEANRQKDTAINIISPHDYLKAKQQEEKKTAKIDLTIPEEMPKIESGKEKQISASTLNKEISRNHNNNSDYSKKKDYSKTTKNKEPEASVEKQSEDDFFETVTDLTLLNNKIISSQEDKVSTISRYSAEIYREQEIVPNRAVEIKLLESVPHPSIDLHHNARLIGVADYKNDRVYITIHSVKTYQGEYPIHMRVLDNDGIEGLFYKSPIEKNLENDKDGYIDRVLGNSYGMDLKQQVVTQAVKDLNNAVLNEKIKPLKKTDYPVFVEFLEQ